MSALFSLRVMPTALTVQGRYQACVQILSLCGLLPDRFIFPLLDENLGRSQLCTALINEASRVVT